MRLREEENLAAAFPGTYLVFQLGEGAFGFEARCLWEISLSAAASPLPPSAPFLSGITHLHGKIVPVLDLGALLGLPDPFLEAARGFVAVKPFGWEAPTGFFVTNILGFEKFPENWIRPPVSQDKGMFRRGHIDASDGNVEILDMERILSSLKPSLPAGPPPDFAMNKGE